MSIHSRLSDVAYILSLESEELAGVWVEYLHVETGRN